MCGVLYIPIQVVVVPHELVDQVVLVGREPVPDVGPGGQHGPVFDADLRRASDATAADDGRPSACLVRDAFSESPMGFFEVRKPRIAVRS